MILCRIIWRNTKVKADETTIPRTGYHDELLQLSLQDEGETNILTLLGCRKLVGTTNDLGVFLPRIVVGKVRNRLEDKISIQLCILKEPLRRNLVLLW